MMRSVLRLLAPAVLCAAVASPAMALDYDKWNAEDINMVCAGCHGEFGEGGGGGVYPRLAGLPAQYMIDQLQAFKERTRVNIPMAPFTNDRELPDEDIRDIVGYLSSIELESRLPEFDEGTDALTRLNAAKKVVQIPRYDGDIKEGKRIYRGDCRLCHGNDGQGKSDTPQLAGQFSEYLKKQLVDMAEGRRSHEDAYIFEEMTEQQMDDLLAYLSILDD